MAAPAGVAGANEDNALDRPTGAHPAIDPKEEIFGLSNPENACFAGFAVYLSLAALRHSAKRREEIAPDLWSEAARDYRRRHPITRLSPEESRAVPALDDPHLEAKLHTAAAPLELRKALLVELWNSLGIEDRLRFLRRVAKPSELRRAAA